MYVNSFPVDPEKFEKLAHKRGVTKSMISKEIGRSDSYIRTSIARGILQSTAAQLIEAKYGIKPDDYAPDPEPAEKPEEAAFSAEELEKIVRKAVSEAVELAVKDTIAKMTRQELVNMMRSTLTTALNDYHNSSIMIERMKSGGVLNGGNTKF